MKTKNQATAELPYLSTDVLVRLWFRRLWQKYDAGGISVGRSMRCDLLDCYLEMTAIPNLKSPLEEYSEGLEKELFRRPVVRGGKLKRPRIELTEIPRYSKRRVALAGLSLLLALEWSVESIVAYQEGYELERKLIKKALERSGYMEVPSKANIGVLARALIGRKDDIRRDEFSKECQHIP